MNSRNDCEDWSQNMRLRDVSEPYFTTLPEDVPVGSATHLGPFDKGEALKCGLALPCLEPRDLALAKADRILESGNEGEVKDDDTQTHCSFQDRKHLSGDRWRSEEAKCAER